VGVQVVAVMSPTGTVVTVTGSTLSATPPVVTSATVPGVPPPLCELNDCRSVLAVIVPLVLTTSVQVAAMVPLKMTFPVAARAGDAASANAAQKKDVLKLIATAYSNRVLTVTMGRNG
jgi:hypothetical protein